MTKQPISERRLAANRANAQKSTGPRTPEGRLRVARNASRHNLYSKSHFLPEDIADLLYRQALEETADIADPRFRALFVHRLMLRGHERRLFQLEGKLWAEALRVNSGIIPYASLWIRENHAEVVQALGRYHAWICVRIRAIQKSIFPYIIGDAAHQTGIPARTHALLASAAGSSRAILLAAEASTAFAAAPVAEDQPSPTGVLSSTLPPVGFPHLLGARGGFRAVRPVPAPQAVKAIRPPTVPGLSLRYLKQSRKPNPAAKSALPAPSPNHPAAVSITLRTAHVSKRATARRAAKPDEPTLAPNTRSTSASPTDNHAQQHSDSDARAQYTLYEQSKPSPEPTPGPVPERHAPSSSPATATAQSTLHERTKPTLVPTPGPVPERHATSSSPATDPAQSTLPERTKPSRPPVSHHPATGPTLPVRHNRQTRGP